MEPSKQCSNCKEVKILREFHRHKREPDGYRTICKKCRATLEGFKYKPPVSPGCKKCSVCNNEFPATEDYFYKDSRLRYGLSYMCIQCAKKDYSRRRNKDIDKSRQKERNYRLQHKASIREIGKRYYQKNKDKIKAYYLAHYKEHLIRGLNWYKNNIDRAREISRNSQRRWQKNNPAAARAVMQRRLARKRNLSDTLTATDWQTALSYFGGCCAYCGRAPGLWHTIAADHFVPLSSELCPGTTKGNMLPACHGQDGCNNSKGDKDPAEWLQNRFGKRKANAILKRINEYFEWVKRQE